MFFIIEALLILSNNNLKLLEEDNFNTFSELYSDWLNNLLDNFKTITGKAVQMNWSPE